MTFVEKKHKKFQTTKKIVIRTRKCATIRFLFQQLMLFPLRFRCNVIFHTKRGDNSRVLRLSKRMLQLDSIKQINTRAEVEMNKLRRSINLGRGEGGGRQLWKMPGKLIECFTHQIYMYLMLTYSKCIDFCILRKIRISSNKAIDRNNRIG